MGKFTGCKTGAIAVPSAVNKSGIRDGCIIFDVFVLVLELAVLGGSSSNDDSCDSRLEYDSISESMTLITFSCILVIVSNIPFISVIEYFHFGGLLPGFGRAI